MGALAEFRNGGWNNVSSPRQYANFTSPSGNPVQVEMSCVSKRQLSDDVAKRFSHEKAKFCGKSTVCSPTDVESYTRMFVETVLSDEWEWKFFHHLFRDHALEFYFDSVEHTVTTYKETLECMNYEFCPIVKMETVDRKLQSLHIMQFENSDKTEEDALREMAKQNQDLTPQTPVECRTDRFWKNILFNFS